MASVFYGIWNIGNGWMEMCDTLKRFGVSMEPALLAQLDDYVIRQGYLNRSQAIRYLVKEALYDSLTEKSVINASIQLTKEALGRRFSKIINRCEKWGEVHTFTMLFVDRHTVCLLFSIEIAKESIQDMQQDPMLQPLTIYMKGDL